MSAQQNPMQQVLGALKAGDAATADALLDEILLQTPAHGPALVIKARLARQWGHYDAAEALLALASDAVGDHPQWLSESGYLALAMGNAPVGIARFEALVHKLPDYADGHFNLAHAYREHGRFESAIVSFERALELNVGQPHEAHTELGSTLLQVRRESDAQAHFERALALRPAYSRALFGLGTVYAAQGDFESALTHFRAALDDDPSFVEAFAQIAAHRRFDRVDDADIIAMQGALAAPAITQVQREKLEFSLGKALDDCGEYDEAFAHYTAANRLKHARSPAYDRARQEDAVARIMETFDGHKSLPELTSSERDRPIIIVGMPRSGTTLIETMLARHPQVDAGGELSFFERVVRPALAPYPAGLERAGVDTLAQLASLYLEELQRAGDAPRTTDKYPANFVHLGTIARLFPDASLIHCSRDPLDTCLSIFFQDFSYGNDYANDLEDVAHYYGQYQRLMTHWSQYLGMRLLHIRYEDVVDEQDIALLRMLDHCDLPYDERCLDAAYDPEVVSTLSRWQVRQPVYATSKARWRHYRGHVERLADALGVELD